MAGASVLILTLNEEENLPRCLDSLKWCDDVVVFDSYSTDKTLEIAAAAGARVVQRRFDNWCTHQNWAMQNIEYRHPWVFYIDADEVMTPELAAEVQRVCAGEDGGHAAFRVRRKDTFWGTWLRRSSMYPIWLTRLFLPAKVRWERLVNPVAVVDGPIGNLQEHLIHYSFNKGLEPWIAKHIKYARFEAEEATKPDRPPVDLRALLSWGDPVARRKTLKELSFRFPCRPLLRFIYMYVLRRGFLDGWRGLTYCRLISMYEHMIDLNVREIRQRRSTRPV